MDLSSELPEDSDVQQHQDLIQIQVSELATAIASLVRSEKNLSTSLVNSIPAAVEDQEGSEEQDNQQDFTDDLLQVVHQDQDSATAESPSQQDSISIIEDDSVQVESVTEVVSVSLQQGSAVTNSTHQHEHSTIQQSTPTRPAHLPPIINILEIVQNPRQTHLTTEVTSDITLPNLEQCCICSANYDKPKRIFPQPDFNRLLTKLLELTPMTLPNGSSFFGQYIPICVECGKKVKKYERLRNEMDVIKQEIISSLTDSFLFIQPKSNPVLQCLRQPFVERWVDRNKQPTSKGKGQVVKVKAPGIVYKKPAKILPKEHFLTPLILQDAGMKIGAWQNLAGEVNIFTSDQVGGNEADHPQQYITAYVADIVDNDDSDHEYEIDSNEAIVPKKRRRPPRKRSRKDGEDNPGLEQTRRLPRRPDKAKQHEKPPYFCECCGRVFSLLKSLRHHALNCTQEPTKPVQCPICFADLSESTWLDLKFHIDLAHPYDCELDKCRHCRMEFLPNSIKDHECVFESSGNVKAIKPHQEYKCDFCNKVYFHTNSLGNHVRRQHRGEKVFTCGICSKTFTATAILNSHMSVHKTTPTTKNAHKCDTCGIFCSTTWGLKQHQTVHSGVKQYHCQLCGKKFRLYQAWRTHEVVHTGERNYNCDICRKSFSLYSTMQRHKKRHINPLPLLPRQGEGCPICGDDRLYLKPSILKRHMLSRHPGTNEQFKICRRADNEMETNVASKCVETIDSKTSATKLKTNKEQLEAKTNDEEISVDEESEIDNDEVITKVEQESDFEEVPADPLTISNDDATSEASTDRSTKMKTRYRGLKKVSVFSS